MIPQDTGTGDATKTPQQAPAPNADTASAGANGPARFDVVLTPHRSLSPAGFAILMTAVIGIAFVGGVVFLLRGAWPVTGFGAIEVGLFYLMFRLNYRSARMHERLRLTDEALEIERHEVGGRVRRWSFQPYWLQVEIADPPQSDSALLLRSHGRSLAIGAFLSPDERLDLAKALRTELARLKEGRA